METLPHQSPSIAQPPFLPVLTQQPKVRWSWVALIQIPWFTAAVLEALSGSILVFTLKKFIDAPMGITLLLSLNVVFNMLVGATCNYWSDHIWTRFGRRRPFLIVAALVAVVFLTIIPLISAFWLLVVVLVAYEMLRDVGAQMEPLEKEVVPPPQRGRGQAITQFARLGGGALFSKIMLPTFDQTFVFGSVSFTGEMIVYWIGALLALATAAFYAFAVREVRPPIEPAKVVSGRGWDVLVHFLGEVFRSRHNWAIYIIGIAMSMFWTGLGGMGTLLYTEQWKFSKAQLGDLQFIGQVFTMFVSLPLGGWFADKLDRINLTVICAALLTLAHVMMFGYGLTIPAGAQPSFVILVLIGFFSSAVSQLGVMSTVALQFDYMPTSQMGTISAGIGITRTIFGLITMNAIGGWVQLYSYFTRRGNSYDYLSGYHYLIFVSILCTGAMIWFAKQAKSGRLTPYGLIEQQARVSEP